MAPRVLIVIRVMQLFRELDRKCVFIWDSPLTDEVRECPVEWRHAQRTCLAGAACFDLDCLYDLLIARRLDGLF